ncbi:hypothetical protein C8R43DRAFT_1164930 [Mycena crocata]|nr:hypothetical protein C8R43DRAFT_1164930 [Mycena crocata]
MDAVNAVATALDLQGHKRNERSRRIIFHEFTSSCCLQEVRSSKATEKKEGIRKASRAAFESERRPAIDPKAKFCCAEMSGRGKLDQFGHGSKLMPRVIIAMDLEKSKFNLKSEAEHRQILELPARSALNPGIRIQPKSPQYTTDLKSDCDNIDVVLVHKHFNDPISAQRVQSQRESTIVYSILGSSKLRTFTTAGLSLFSSEPLTRMLPVGAFLDQLAVAAKLKFASYPFIPALHNQKLLLSSQAQHINSEKLLACTFKAIAQHGQGKLAKAEAIHFSDLLYSNSYYVVQQKAGRSTLREMWMSSRNTEAWAQSPCQILKVRGRNVGAKQGRQVGDGACDLWLSERMSAERGGSARRRLYCVGAAWGHKEGDTQPRAAVFIQTRAVVHLVLSLKPVLLASHSIQLLPAAVVEGLVAVPLHVHKPLHTSPPPFVLVTTCHASPNPDSISSSTRTYNIPDIADALLHVIGFVLQDTSLECEFTSGGRNSGSTFGVPASGDYSPVSHTRTTAARSTVREIWVDVLRFYASGI